MAKAPQKRTELQLSERIENYRKQIQFLVKQGGEQPEYEFKRAVSLSRENLGDRLDFVKLIQATANAEIASERCIVIGGDPKEKRFCPVANADEFDSANLSKILGAYLEPMPRFQRFNLTTDDDELFVLIVLDADQPRPIFVVKQGHSETGKTRLEVGDVWIKKNTDTVRATRADFDAIYSVKVEEEAEDRARKRLKHLQELTAPPYPAGRSAVSVPSIGLLVGPKNDLRRYAEELIAGDDLRRFKMLLELAREALVEGWDKLTVRSPAMPSNVKEFTTELNDFYRNEFLVSLEAVVELCLLVIKHDADESWLSGAIDLLVETFNAARNLALLKSGLIMHGGDSPQWWRPAFEVYVGIRAAAIHAVSRKRLRFLGTILPRIATRISIDDSLRTKTPILFWPFRSVEFPEFREGRAAFFWKERIAAAWGSYFGSMTKFLDSSSQLEFLLELNSYLGTNTPNDARLRNWLEVNLDEHTTFTYMPDLYAQDLQGTAPMADLIYDILSSSQVFPPYLAVEPRLFGYVFGDKNPPARLDIYGGFLDYLLRWQAEVRRQWFRYWGFMWSWEGRVGELLKEYRERQKQSPKP